LLGPRRGFDRRGNQTDFLVTHRLEHADHECIASGHPRVHVLKGRPNCVTGCMRRQHPPEARALLAQAGRSLGRQTSTRRVGAGS
jgi:hypothetical protein